MPCPVPGCPYYCYPPYLFCADHWAMLPWALQAALLIEGHFAWHRPAHLTLIQRAYSVCYSDATLASHVKERG